MPRRITPEEYNDIFKENYPNYELLSVYNGDKNYITVKCKIDGYVWETKPNWLKQGARCQKCYNKNRGEATRIGIKDFIAKSNIIHNNKYDYSKVEYINSKIKVCIICPKHGEFWQTPNKHINRKDGCPLCKNENNGLKKRISLEDFIKKSNIIHHNKYDYSKTEYQGWNKPITIICKKHGEFTQTAGVHLSGCGCPKCKQSKLEKIVGIFLKDNNINFIEQKKFEWLGRMSLDFYLPDYNIAIECQGVQHYNKELIKWDKFNFNDIIERDKLKKNLCYKNGILIYYLANDNNILNYEMYNSDNATSSLLKLLSFIQMHKKIK